MEKFAHFFRSLRLRRLLNINPSYILAILLTASVLAAVLEREIQDRRSAVIEAQDSYLAALTATRTQLSGLMERAVADKPLAHSLSTRQEHTTRSALEAQLQKGGLDQLALVTANCEQKTRVSVERYVPITCPEAKSDQRAHFFWTTHNDTPMLALMRALPDQGGELFLFGAVRLDNFWLSKQQQLATMLDHLGITIAAQIPGELSAPHSTILKEGSLSGGGFAASLISRNVLDRFLLSNAGKDIAYGNPFLMPILLLSLVVCFLIVVREKALTLRLAKAGEDLVEWARGISPVGGFTAPGKAAVNATGIPAEDLKIAKQFVAKALDLKAEQIHKMGQRRELAENRIKELSTEIIALQKRLSELAELDSLAVQLGNTSEGFLNHAQDMNLKAEDLSDIAGTEMAERASLLHNMMMEWQEGVATRGARKFIRTLSESPGRAKDSTLLDEQIITIATMAGELSDLAINSSLIAHKIAETSSFCARIAGLWHGIALKTNSDKVCKSLIPVMEDAQQLIRQNKKYRNIVFQNMVAEEAAAEIPEIPVTLWQSAMFQIYASFAELSSGKSARIVSKIRKDGSKSMFVVHIAGEDGVQLPQRTQRQTYLLDVAKYVLTPFDVKVTALPSLDGPFPVALSWTTCKGELSVGLLGDEKKRSQALPPSSETII